MEETNKKDKKAFNPFEIESVLDERW